MLPLPFVSCHIDNLCHFPIHPFAGDAWLGSVFKLLKEAQARCRSIHGVLGSAPGCLECSSPAARSMLDMYRATMPYYIMCLLKEECVRNCFNLYEQVSVW